MRHVPSRARSHLLSGVAQAVPMSAVQVFREFQISVEEDALLSRCSKCNGEFINRCVLLPY